MERLTDNLGGVELSLEDARRLLAGMPESNGVQEEKSPMQLEVEAKHKTSMELAGMLRDAVCKLHNELKGAKSVADMRAHLRSFYEKEFPKVAYISGRLGIENTNSLKLLRGVYMEYMNLLMPGADNNILNDEKIMRLNAFFVGFASALGEVNYRSNWDEAEQSIGTLINVTGVEENEMADLNLELELVEPKNLKKVEEIVENAVQLDQKSLTATLDRFAKGETGLDEMARLAEIWERVKVKVNAVVEEGTVYEDDNIN